MSCRRNSPSSSGVQVTESSKKGCLVLGKKIIWTTSVTLICSKGFVAASEEAIFIKCQLKITGSLVWSSVEWEGGRAGGCSLWQSKCIWLDDEEETTASKKIIVLNHLWVIHL